MAGKDNRETLVIPPIELQWSDWIAWNTVVADVRDTGVRVPKVPGVYEAKYADQEERLTIGKATNLEFRMRQALIKGAYGHPAGTQIRAHEDVTKIVVRWAPAERRAAVEEELHGRHQQRFGRLPRYVQHT